MLNLVDKPLLSPKPSITTTTMKNHGRSSSSNRRSSNSRAIELKFDNKEVAYGRETQQFELTRIIKQQQQQQQQCNDGQQSSSSQSPKVMLVHGKKGCGKTQLIQSMKSIWTTSSSSSSSAHNNKTMNKTNENENETDDNTIFISATFDEEYQQQHQQGEEEEDDDHSYSYSSIGTGTGSSNFAIGSSSNGTSTTTSTKRTKKKKNIFVNVIEELCRIWIYNTTTTTTTTNTEDIEKYLQLVQEYEMKLESNIPRFVYPSSTTTNSKNNSGSSSSSLFPSWSWSSCCTLLDSSDTTTNNSKTCSLLYETKLGIQLLLNSICHHLSTQQQSSSQQHQRQVILFLDDFQYVDQVSLDLLNFLLVQQQQQQDDQDQQQETTTTTGGLTLILAYRDEEEEEDEIMTTATTTTTMMLPVSSSSSSSLLDKAPPATTTTTTEITNRNEDDDNNNNNNNEEAVLSFNSTPETTVEDITISPPAETTKRDDISTTIETVEDITTTETSLSSSSQPLLPVEEASPTTRVTSTTTTTTTINVAIQAIQKWKCNKRISDSIHDIYVNDLNLVNTGKMISGILQHHQSTPITTTTTNNNNPSDTTSSSSTTDTINNSTPLQQLINIIYNKTNGNPYCICQCLQQLYKDGYLFYSLLTYQWELKMLSTISMKQLQLSIPIYNVHNANTIITTKLGLLLQPSPPPSPPTKLEVVETTTNTTTTTIEEEEETRQRQQRNEVLMVASCLGTNIPFQILQLFFSSKTNNATKKIMMTTTGDEEKESEESEEFAIVVPDDSSSSLSTTITPAPITTIQTTPISNSYYSSEELKDILDCAVRMEILTTKHSSTTSSSSSSEDDGGENTDDTINIYNWSHERIHEAVYSMISKRDKVKFHLQLGKVAYKLRKSLLSSTSTSTTTITTNTNQGDEWLVYLIRDQFSKVSSYISDKNMRISLTKLNLEAAQLCMTQQPIAAYYPAWKMLREGIQLLDSTTKWKEGYELCMEIYTLLAELSYSLGYHDSCKRALEIVLRHTKKTSHQQEETTTTPTILRAYIAYIQSIATVTGGKYHNYTIPIDKLLELLAIEGIRIRSNPGKTQVLSFMSTLPMKQLEEELSNLPIMRIENDNDIETSPSSLKSSSYSQLMKSKLLCLLAMYAVYDERMLLAELAILHCTRIALESGICTYLPTAVAVQGLILMHQGKIELAQQQARISLDMVKRLEEENTTTSNTTAPGAAGGSCGSGEVHVRTIQLVYSGIINAIRPFHESLDIFMEVHQMGLARKDLEYGILGGKHYSLCYLAIGLPLGPLEGDLATFTEEAIQSGLGPSIEINFRIFRQTILNLQGKVPNPTILKGEAIDAQAFLSEMQGNSLSIARCDVATFQLMLACIYNDLDTAEKMLNILEPFPFTDLVVARGHIRLLFMGLAGFALSRKRGLHPFRYLLIARKVVKQFELAVKHGSVNAHPVLELLRAEESPSREAYDRAIRTSARSGLMHLQAMINERAGRFFLDQSDEEDAIFYLSKAEHLYQDWGATGKVAQLHHDHAFLASMNDELHHRGVSVGLKGRKRVSIRDFAAIHDYDKFPSQDNLQRSDDGGGVSNKSPEGRNRKQSLGLGTLDLSFDNDESTEIQLSPSCSRDGLDSLDGSSSSFSLPDEEPGSRRISSRLGIFTSSKRPSSSLDGSSSLSFSNNGESQRDFLSPRRQKSGTALAAMAGSFARGMRLSDGEVQQGGNRSGSFLSPRRQKSGTALAAMAGFTRGNRPNDGDPQSATNATWNQTGDTEGGSFSTPRRQKSGTALAAMAGFTRGNRTNDGEPQSATNATWNQQGGNGGGSFSAPRRQKSGTALAAMAGFARGIRPNDGNPQSATNATWNQTGDTTGGSFSTPRRQKSGTALAAMAGFTRGIRPNDGEPQSATNSTWNQQGGNGGGSFSAPRRQKSGAALSNMARGIRRTISGVSNDMQSSLHVRPSSSDERASATWDNAGATTTTTTTTSPNKTMKPSLSVSRLKRSNLTSSRSKQALRSPGLSGQSRLHQNDTFNHNSSWKSGDGQNVPWHTNDDQGSSNMLMKSSSNGSSSKSSTRLASIMGINPAAASSSSGRVSLSRSSGSSLASAGRAATTNSLVNLR